MMCATKTGIARKTHLHLIHAAKARRAANAISSLISLPTDIISHSPIITCIITLAAIVHLSSFSQGVSTPSSEEQIRLNIGNLGRLGHVWATASAVGQQISGLAQQLFTPGILEGRLTQDTSWP